MNKKVQSRSLYLFRVILLTLLGFLVIPIDAIGQGRVPDFNSGDFTGRSGNININNADTIDRPELRYTSYHLYDIRVPIYNLDTLVNDIHVLESQYKEAFITPNFGTDNSPSQWQPWYVPNKGVRLGSHLYDRILHHTAEPAIVKVNRSFAEIHAIQQVGRLGRSRGASSFASKFYRSFARKILLNFNYKSHNDQGDISLQGNDQDAQFNSVKRLDIKMSQESKKGNRISFVHYDRSTMTQNINRAFFGTADMISLNQINRTVTFGNNIMFRDSATAPVKYSLDTKLALVQNNYSSSSENLSTNGSSFVLLDLPGDTLSYSNLTNEIRLSNSLSIPTGDGAILVNLELNRIVQGIGNFEDINFFESILDLRYYNSINSKISYDLSGDFGLIDASGYRSIKGMINYNYSDHLQLQLKSESKSTIPSLLHQRLVVNNVLLQDAQWNNPSGTSVQLSAHVKPTSSSVDLSFHTYSNLITIGNRGLFEQIVDPVSRLQAVFNQELKVGPFMTHHAVMFQSISDDNFSVPSINYTGNIYLQFYLFKKKMLTRLGSDVYFIPSFDTPEFYAITGEFYNNQQEVGNNVVILNPYLNAKVGPFHIFVKGIDLLHRLQATGFQEVLGSPRPIFDYSLTTGLPRQDFKIRFGIKWTFLD